MGLVKATKQDRHLRMTLAGPPGSGKTFSALAIGCALAEAAGGRAAVVDTEHNSAGLYSDMFDFDSWGEDQPGGTFKIGLHPPYSPEHYMKAMAECSAAAPVVIIDSLSHGWQGAGGFLEINTRIADKSYRGNGFAAWKDTTPQYERFVEFMLSLPAHLIVTMRAKTDWVIEDNAQGKKSPKKVGMAARHREGIEYEFDVACDLTLEHKMIVSKTRCHAIADEVILKPGREFAETLLGWLRGAPEDMIYDEQRELLAKLVASKGATKEMNEYVAKQLAGELTAIAAGELIVKLERRLAKAGS